jgi:hypothetical protein
MDYIKKINDVEHNIFSVMSKFLDFYNKDTKIYCNLMLLK